MGWIFYPTPVRDIIILVPKGPAEFGSMPLSAESDLILFDEKPYGKKPLKQEAEMLFPEVG